MKKEKTKITILSAFPKYSAIWNYAYFLNKHLSKSKYDVKLIDLWENKKYRSDIRRGFALLNGIEVKNADVLIVVSPLLANSLKKTDAKLKITIVHDLHPITHPEQVSFPIRTVVRGTYRNVGYSDILLPVSEFTKENIAKIFNFKNVIKTIHGGINHDIFNIDRKIKSKKQTQRKTTFLHVGRDDVRKNFIFALELLKRFRDAKMIKIGETSKEEMKFIEKNNLDVEIVVSVSSEELAKYYNESDLLLFPSTYEGLGLPPIEAMACGCPVIAANNTGLKEVSIKESLLPLNLGLWEEKARKILENKEYRNKMIKSGIKKSKDFDWKKYAREVEKMIDENLNLK